MEYILISLPASPIEVPNLFSFWGDRRPAACPEAPQHISMVHNSLDPPLSPDERPGEVESRLDLLQVQLDRYEQSTRMEVMFLVNHLQVYDTELNWLHLFYSRLESRMSSDINIILQLLQRQLSQIPPAYSPISPSSHTLGLYHSASKSLEPMQSNPSLPTDSPISPLQVSGLLCSCSMDRTSGLSIVSTSIYIYFHY